MPRRPAPATPAAIESPCIDVCVIDPQSRLCKGCLRSIDEITAITRNEWVETTFVVELLAPEEDS